MRDMRHNSRRMKNRSNNNNNNNNGPRRNNNVPPRMQVFDSNGPDVRIRGTAWQVHEKYQALAKDAAATGDVIMAENYSQHAEHYQRIINTFAEQMGGQQWAPQGNANDGSGDTDGEVAVQVQSTSGQMQAATPPQQQNMAPRTDRRDDAPRGERRDDTPRGERRNDDLGLPASLFKPAQPATNLESA